MIIERIDFRAYSWQRAVPISNGRHTYTDSLTCVVEVTTDEGVTGIGLGVGATLPLGHKGIHGMVESYTELLRGQDPLRHEHLWSMLWQPKLAGRRGLETRAISMIDIALWDIKAKTAGMPLYRLLGAARTEIPFYVAGGYYETGKGHTALVDEMLDHLTTGARAVKMKIGRLSLRDDIERVAAVRAGIGPDIRLLVDANASYSPQQAAAMARALEELDVFWFEEPLAADDYRGHGLLGQASSVPIATGENESTRFGFRDLVDSGGVAILNADAEIAGGVTEFVKIAALADAAGVVVAPHGRPEIHTHLACGIPNGLMVEYYRPNVDPLAELLVPERPVIADGMIIPSESPGAGQVLDEDAVKEFRVV